MPLGMERKLKAGIIGYGLAGRYFHAPNLIAAGFEVAAICARSIEKKGAAHDDFPSAIIVSSIEELVEEDLDLIVVASTNDVHADHAKAAIDSAIPVVVDKPMARDYDETRELFDYADSRNVPITVFFNRLWDSDTLTIKRILSENEIGDPIRFESRFERFRPELNPNAWRESSDEGAGGGLLLDLQTHLVSTALALFGSGSVVHSSVRSIRGGANDDVTITLRHDSGVDSYLSASAVIGAPGPRIRMNCRNGSLIIKDLDGQEALLRKGYQPTKDGWPNPEDVTTQARIYKGDDSYSPHALPGNYVTFYRNVDRAIREGAPMPITREFALEVAYILDQAKELSSR